MIILGIILVIVGYLVDIPVLVTIGVILAVIGLVLMLLGASGRAIGGRRQWSGARTRDGHPRVPGVREHQGDHRDVAGRTRVQGRPTAPCIPLPRL